MIVLSHRGYWQCPSEKNSGVAFRRSFALGFGVEADVRDRNGELVLCHEMPAGGELSLADFLDIHDGGSLPLALNIKADGLVAPLVNAMDARNIGNWFVFDMSVPDMRAYLEAGVPVFARMSEVEREPAWLERCAGVWLDGFCGIWYDVGQVAALLRQDKRVCIVSSELHGRDAEPLWKMLQPVAAHPALMLCTDYPARARDFFGENS
jgi:hypothetical protein